MTETLLLIGLAVGALGWLGCALAALRTHVLWMVMIIIAPFSTVIYYAKARSVARPWLILQLCGAVLMMPEFAMNPTGEREEAGRPQPEKFVGTGAPDEEESEEEEAPDMAYLELDESQRALLQLGQRLGPGGREQLRRQQREVARAWHGLLIQRTRLFELLPPETQTDHRDELAAYQILLESTKLPTAPTPEREAIPPAP